MRRLIAYLTLTITTLLIIATNFLSVAGGLNANLEFSSGREMVFRITDKNDDTITYDTNEEVTTIAATMRDRLDNALVTNFAVLVEGNNQVRVTVSESTQTNYRRLEKYLGFDSEFTICTRSEVCATNDEMFEGQTARVEYQGQNPFVVFKLKDPQKLKDSLVTEANGGQEGGSTDGELLLWAGKLESDSYQESLQDTKMAEKILLRFPTASMWWDPNSLGNETELQTFIAPSKYGSPDERNIFPAAAVAQANEEAVYLRNLFNATALNVNVELLFSKSIPASVEPLLSLGNFLSLALSQTLLATCITSVLVILVLFVLYRVQAFAIVTTAALSLFLSMVALIWLNLEFSSGALIALFLIGFLAVFTSTHYLTLLRREIYQGRSFKKSHAEAFTKLRPFILDTTIATLTLGLGLYLFAGILARSFAVLLMVGSLSNLIVVYLGNQLLFGVLLAEHGLQKRLAWLRLNPAYIPDVIKDEKPVYFGRFSGRDFTSKGPLISPLAFVVAGIAFITMVTLSALDIALVQPAFATNEHRLYLEVKDFSEFVTTNDVKEKILEAITIDGETLIFDDNIEVHELVRVEEKINVDYRIYVVLFDEDFASAETFTFTEDGFEINDFNLLLEHIVYSYYEDEQVSSIGFYRVSPVTADNAIVTMATGLFIALMMVGVYLFFRGSLARALTFLFIAGATVTLTLAFFMVTRIAVYPTLLLGVISVGFAFMVSAFAIFAYAQQLLKTIQDRAITRDDVGIALKKSTSQSASFIFLSLATLVYASLAFFGLGPTVLQGLFAALLLGVGLTALLVTGMIPSVYKPLYRFAQSLQKVLFVTREANKQTKVVEEVRSAEPQEATYIGIND
jgi:preprotein translocase subunit SecD